MLIAVAKDVSERLVVPSLFGGVAGRRQMQSFVQREAVDRNDGRKRLAIRSCRGYGTALREESDSVGKESGQ